MTSQNESEDRSEGCSRADSKPNMPEAVVRDIAGNKKRRGSGGPKTVAGKRVASQNATNHGILSRRPIVGDEKLEDWIALLDAACASLQPGAPFENVIINLLCHNVWQQYRQIQYHTRLIESQIDGAGFRSRRTLEETFESLPEDERIWSGYDAGRSANCVRSCAFRRASDD